MKLRALSVALSLFLLLLARPAQACVECSGGWCYPALGWGYLHCSIHCPGDPNADCVCFAGGGFCQGAQAPADTSLARLKPSLPAASKEPRFVKTSNTITEAPMPSNSKRQLPPNCTSRDTPTGAKVYECGPKIGRPAISSFSFKADPAQLLQLAEINKDLAFLLFRASSIQREMRLDIAGGAISARVPQSAAAVRAQILGASAGDSLTAPVQYQFTRLGQTSDGSVRFVFAPQEPTRGISTIVEFAPSPDAAFDFVMTGWRQR
jgi:hypothetical protein